MNGRYSFDREAFEAEENNRQRHYEAQANPNAEVVEPSAVSPDQAGYYAPPSASLTPMPSPMMPMPAPAPYYSGTGASYPSPYDYHRRMAAAQLNSLALASWIVAIVFSPVGLIMAYKAREQIRMGKGYGEGHALAGIIIGWVGTVLFVFNILLQLFVIALPFILSGA